MNWQGQEIKHDTYGTGRIVNVDGNYVTVRFESVGDKYFQFPQALGGILKLDDIEARAEAHRLIEEKKEKMEKIKARKEKLRSRIEVDLNAELMRRYEKQQRARKRKSKSSAGSRKRSNTIFKCDLYDPEKDEEPEYNGITYEEAKLGQEITSDDYEADSEVFNTWTLHAGRFISGQKQGQGIRMAKARPQSLAILTILPDGAEEEERVITAVYLVDKSYEGDPETPAWVQNTDPQYRLKFTEDEAHDLKIWRYYSNQTNPERIRMGSGLFRYIDDVQSAHVLRAIADLLKGTDREEQAQQFFEYYCQINQLDPKHLDKNEGPLSAHFHERDDVPDLNDDEEDDDEASDDDAEDTSEKDDDEKKDKKDKDDKEDDE